MKRFKWLSFKKKQKEAETKNIESNPEFEYVELIVGMLESNPENWKIDWFEEGIKDKSVQSNCREIYVMTTFGEILKPNEFKMTQDQIRRSKAAISKIEENFDKKQIEILINNFKKTYKIE